MNRKHHFNSHRGATILFAIAVMLSGCSNDPEKTVQWEEDVALSSGAAIVINRTQIYRRVGEPGQGSGWLFDRASLTARLPGKEPVQWSGQLQPLILDFGPNQQTYLLTTVQTYRGQQAYNVPEGVYHVAFKWTDATWNQIPIDDFPSSLRPNLLASTYLFFIDRSTPSGTHVTVSVKRELDSRATLGEPYKGLKK